MDVILYTIVRADVRVPWRHRGRRHDDEIIGVYRVEDVEVDHIADFPRKRPVDYLREIEEPNEQNKSKCSGTFGSSAVNSLGVCQSAGVERHVAA